MLMGWRMKLLADNGKTIVADLPPAYFALVMATGIVSIAAHLLGFGLVAVALLCST